MALNITKLNLSIYPILKNINIIAFNVRLNPVQFESKMGFKTCVLYKAQQQNTVELEKLLQETPEKRISSHMKRYLARSKEHEEFIKKEIAEYNVGLRHLANIMGTTVDQLNKKNIKKYIEYLFPSGLYDKRARPVLEHPEEYYGTYKAAEFDLTGRPCHAFYYTTKPHYYKALHDATHWYNTLDAIEDNPAAHSTPIKKNDKFNIENLQNLSKTALESLLNESLTTRQHEYFTETINRLIEHPYAIHAKKFIEQYTEKKEMTDKNFPCLPVQYDQNKRPYVRVTRCMRKSSRGEVIVYGDGSGNIEINGQNILYFKEQYHREQIVFPLIFTGLGNKVDIVAKIQGGGPTGQVGAIRWGIAQGLLSFVDQEMKLKLKLAGLLTRDWRRRERKKVGQEGARRKFTWKKR